MEREAGKLQTAARVVLTPPFRFCWRITTEGSEHIPATGGAIIAPNHISVLDSFFVPLCVGRRMTYVGKAEYMDDWKTKWVFPAIGMIPIDRSGGDASQRALDAAAGVLEAGELFGIYPEGTRARDGKLHKGHTGLARLALRTGAPIVPVGIIGTDVVQPPDAKFPKPFRRVHIRFGRPDLGRAVRGPGRRPHAPASDHRRGHVRDPQPLGPGVRRQLRRQAGRAGGGGAGGADARAAGCVRPRSSSPRRPAPPGLHDVVVRGRRRGAAFVVGRDPLPARSTSASTCELTSA